MYYSKNTLLPLFIPAMLEKMQNVKSRNISSCSCNATKEQLFINYDGNVYLCPSLIKEEYRIGNILDNSEDRNLMENKAYENIQKIYPYNFNRCKECDVNIFCWHCPAIIDAVKNQKEELNNWCKLMKPLLNKIIWDEGVE